MSEVFVRTPKAVHNTAKGFARCTYPGIGDQSMWFSVCLCGEGFWVVISPQRHRGTRSLHREISLPSTRRETKLDYLFLALHDRSGQAG